MLNISVVFKWFLVFSVLSIIFFPLYWIFISSITPAGELFNSPIDYLPDNPTLSNYLYLIQHVGLIEKIVSTLITVGISIIVSTVVCVMCAYVFARYQSKGLTVAFIFIIFSMLIPAVVTARPLYDFMRKVNLFDTYLGLVILYTSKIIPFSVLILKNYFSEIPASIEEAAEIDGASFVQKLVYIVIPLARPGIATVVIINFIICLNEFFIPLFYANHIQVLSTGLITLPLKGLYSVQWDLVSAMGWVIIFPIIIFVLIFEKQIMTGIMSGAVKG